MFKKGDNYYIADAESNKIYAVKAANFSFEKIYSVKGLESTKNHLAGITWDGKSVWICAGGLQKLFRKPFKDLRKS
jgi:hypothetical protein